MAAVTEYKCLRDCTWNGRYWEKGNTVTLTASAAKGIPRHFAKVEPPAPPKPQAKKVADK